MNSGQMSLLSLMRHMHASDQRPRCDADLAAKCATAFTQIIFMKLISDVSRSISLSQTVFHIQYFFLAFILLFFSFFFHFC